MAALFDALLEEAISFNKVLEYLALINPKIPLEIHSGGFTIHQGGDTVGLSSSGGNKGKKTSLQDSTKVKKISTGSATLNVARIDAQELGVYIYDSPEKEHVIMLNGKRLVETMQSIKSKQTIRLTIKKGESPEEEVLRYSIADQGENTVQLLIDTTNDSVEEPQFSEEDQVVIMTADRFNQFCDTVKTDKRSSDLLVKVYPKGISFTSQTYGLKDSRVAPFGVCEGEPTDSYVISGEAFRALHNKVNKISYSRAMVKISSKRDDAEVGVLRIAVRIATYGELNVYIFSHEDA